MTPRYLQDNAYNLSICVAHTRPIQLLSLQSPFSHGFPCLPSLHLLSRQLPLLKKSFLFSGPASGGGVSRLSLASAPQDLYVGLCSALVPGLCSSLDWITRRQLLASSPLISRLKKSVTHFQKPPPSLLHTTPFKQQTYPPRGQQRLIFTE